MERKALAALGLLALVALAGCSATGSLSINTADDAEIAEAASRPVVVDSPAPDDRRVVWEAIENGSGTATATEIADAFSDHLVEPRNTRSPRETRDQHTGEP